MKPKHFEQVNVIMGKGQPEYEPLPALAIDGGMQVITCWELSPEEIERVKQTGEIWLNVYTFGKNFPPVFLTTERKELFTITDESN